MGEKLSSGELGEYGTANRARGLVTAERWTGDPGGRRARQDSGLLVLAEKRPRKARENSSNSASTMSRWSPALELATLHQLSGHMRGDSQVKGADQKFSVSSLSGEDCEGSSSRAYRCRGFRLWKDRSAALYSRYFVRMSLLKRKSGSAR